MATGNTLSAGKSLVNSYWTPAPNKPISASSSKLILGRKRAFTSNPFIKPTLAWINPEGIKLKSSAANPEGNSNSSLTKPVSS